MCDEWEVHLHAVIPFGLGLVTFKVEGAKTNNPPQK